ncbi:tripartite tricarboxylate transporter substrate binding protein [Roseomonas sp. KE2513]|uniref:Bug family tripartite tricarboxylate transporter substrate binding protein n=1 Tax=Roseomonas sp. KE2513 TaxID=2479202 RepID=UPI0018DF9628|nr:tripartite tricarboxylate transporter substrate binding protein [Roseomonas sp. KE2513]MBI0539538.1 tripartite tricarboxylate transporter substrate binding protein [Roseomonas sp. KE2513]
MLTRRIVLGASGLTMIGSHARAENYPSRPIRLVVPYAPGGGTDIAGRLTAARLSTALGQTVVVENRGGAGGNIGTQVVAAAPNDGYTLLFAANSMTINAALYANPGFDVVRDFAPIAGVASTTVVLVVRADMPVKTLPEFIAYARARPGELNHGTPGPGTPQHLAAELFDSMAGTKIIHVPYRGTAPSVTGLLSGEVNLMFASVSAVEPLIKDGRIRAIAVTSSKRSSAWPDLPTISEVLNGYECDLWYAILGPRGMAAPSVETVDKAVAEMMKDPEFIQLMQTRGFEPTYLPAARLAAVLAQDLDRWKKLGQATGIKME